MKKRILTPLLLFFFATMLSQPLKYEVRGKNSPPTKKEKLATAQFMSDLIPSYPSKWIMGYVSTEITATKDGKVVKATGIDDMLSAEQKNLLTVADLGTELVIKIKYASRNAVTDALETSTLRYTTRVVPEIEAEYPRGAEHMTRYLTERVLSQMDTTASNKYAFVTSAIRFTVNESGEIANVQITSGSSVDPKVNQLLLEAIHNMPKWKPAENAKGLKVKQEFELSLLGRRSDGC